MELKHIKAIEVGDIVTLFDKDEYLEYIKQLGVEIDDDMYHKTPDGVSNGGAFFEDFVGKTFEVGYAKSQLNSIVFRVIRNGKLVPYWLSAYQVKSVSSPNEKILKLIIT